MGYKFQKLEVYQIALDYLDGIYSFLDKLPDFERFNLKDQLRRSGTSIVLNISEGSTSRSDLEQKKFLNIAVGSFLETVACLDIIERRNYLTKDEIKPIRKLGDKLFAKLQAFRSAL